MKKIIYNPSAITFLLIFYFILIGNINTSFAQDYLDICATEDTTAEYLYFDNIIGRFKMNDKDQYFELKIKKIQLDNQLVDAMFPVAATNAKYLDEEKFFLHISMVRNYKENDFDFIPYFSVLIQEAKVQTDWVFIKHLIEYFKQLNDIPQLVDEDNEQFKSIMDDPITEPVDTRKTYLNLLQLHPVRINSTFIFNRKRDDHSSFAIWAQTLGAFNVKIDGKITS